MVYFKQSPLSQVIIYAILRVVIFEIFSMPIKRFFVAHRLTQALRKTFKYNHTQYKIGADAFIF